jgi:tRNA threonylcarbamoyladenosine biosynthesis protein TsaB
MLLLAFDTSTRQASVALCDEECLYGEYTWHVGNKHSVELLERIQRISTECGIVLSALDGLAVAIGPGSFNGVRVAVATAKALAFALRKPLVGISTLEIAAAQYQQWPGLVCSLLEAGRSEVYAACYLFEGQESAGIVTYSPRQLGEYRLLAVQDLAQYVQEQVSAQHEMLGEQQVAPYLFCGEISELSRQELARSFSDQVFFGQAIQSARRASLLASLAQQRLAENRVDDPALLEPLYLRRPSITMSARKQPLLGNKASQTDHSEDQHSTEREEGALRH